MREKRSIKQFFGRVATLVATVVVAVVGYSCSTEMDFSDGVSNIPPDSGHVEFRADFGTIDISKDTFASDSGIEWAIVEVSDAVADAYCKLTDGERVFLNYTVLSWSELQICINTIYPIGVKAVKVLADMSQQQIDALGLAPIYPVMVSISGGYVNMCLATTTEHSIEQAEESFDLIYDSGASTMDTAVFMLRHSHCCQLDTAADEDYLLWMSFRLPDVVASSFSLHTNYFFNWFWWDDTNSSVELLYGTIEPTPYSKFCKL